MKEIEDAEKESVGAEKTLEAEKRDKNLSDGAEKLFQRFVTHSLAKNQVNKTSVEKVEKVIIVTRWWRTSSRSRSCSSFPLARERRRMSQRSLRSMRMTTSRSKSLQKVS